mgnify:CR=1 FL=1
MLQTILAVVISIIIVAPITWFVANAYRRNVIEKKIGSAEDKAREIIDEALKTAETKKKEALLEVKEESIKTKNELDKETKERRAEVQKYERRVLAKEETLDKKLEAAERRDANLARKEEELNRKRQEVEELSSKRVQELERISGFTSEEAKEYLLKSVEDEVKIDTAKLYKELESRAKEEAGRKAKEYVVTAIQKCAVDHVSESTISVVQLPSDEMKGRIIGREGRNIRALEAATGIEIIVDDTPEAIILSGFDPVRREIARLALHQLVTDGRIHPARIEEVVAKVQKQIEEEIVEVGKRTAIDLGIHGLHPELIRMIGKMKYRSSYGQNLLQHARETANLAGIMASELGLNPKIARRAGLLHDIGKVPDDEPELPHAIIGMKLAEKYKEKPEVCNAIGAHHDEIEMSSLIAPIIQVCDAISGARPGARREVVESYIKRLKEMEDIALSYPGVVKTYAIQAGRELRVIVGAEKLSDMESESLSHDIAKKIQDEMTYPGQVKITVIRETRAVAYAK